MQIFDKKYSVQQILFSGQPDSAYNKNTLCSTPNMVRVFICRLSIPLFPLKKFRVQHIKKLLVKPEM